MSKGSTQDVGREEAKRSRRELLAGAAVGPAGAIGAAAVTRPTPARAANFDAVKIAESNVGTGVTTLDNTSGGDGFAASAGDGSGYGYGLFGLSGSGSGVLGDTASG